MFQRLRKFAQTTTYLGIAVIIIVWCVVVYLTHGEHRRAYEDGLRQGRNLSRIFQQYISRVVGDADTTLKALREVYQRDPEDFDMSRLADIGQLGDDLVGQFAIFGTDGFMKLGTLSSLSTNSVTDRDYFRVQAQAKTDELYISVPLVGRWTHRALFVLARRLTARDGSFDGLVVATINIHKLEDFYNSIDIGPRGTVSLDGFDGIVRARAGRDPAGQDLVGKSYADTKLFSLFRQSPQGYYWNFEQSAQPLDGVRRLISYQNVDGLPLIAVVGLAESDIFEQADSTAHRYYLFAFVLTAAVIGAIGIGAKRQEKLSATLAALEQSKSSLERVNLWFNTALMNMMHGLSMFDKDQRLILCNDRYREIYRLAVDRSMPGTTLLSLLKDRMVDKRPEEVEAYVEDHMRSLYRLGSAYDEIKMLDGRVIARACQTMPNGGWVTIHEDITDRRRSDEHQALLISELDHRVKNILARVAVVAKYTLEGRCPKKELAEALDRRIQSMADAHAMLSQSHWLGVSLGDLVRRQLAPYATKTNIAISGPDTTLSPAQAQAMAMVLQELATNAVKYGSLSTSHGKVSVIWDCRDGADGATCAAITWQETGGPKAEAPRQTSYGTNLIRNLIPHELGGTVALVYAPDGVRCDIEIPLSDPACKRKIAAAEPRTASATYGS